MTIVEYLRLSEKKEGHISNPHRELAGFLAELPHEMLLSSDRTIDVNPLEMPIVGMDL